MVVRWKTTNAIIYTGFTLNPQQMLFLHLSQNSGTQNILLLNNAKLPDKDYGSDATLQSSDGYALGRAELEWGILVTRVSGTMNGEIYSFGFNLCKQVVHGNTSALTPVKPRH